jgi:GMP synthase (glutamine-hydrolysing)
MSFEHTIDHVTVLDFGGQYAHLIANRVRGLGVYCAVMPPEDFLAGPGDRTAGLILSGGPQSVTDAHVQMMKLRLDGYSKPILGICFGHQLLAKLFGGELAHGRDRQYGPTPVRCDPSARLFAGLPEEQSVWMSHGDHVAQVPPGFRVTATTDSCPVAAYEAVDRNVFGLQFHPEVVHTPHGSAMLENFLSLCKIRAPWVAGSMRRRVIEQTRAAAGDATLFLLVSGGVDSLVTLQVCIEAVGPERVRSLHVDTGLMRLGESDDILKFLAAEGFRNIEIERAEALFLRGLAGVAEPEQKRAIIGRLFVEVLRGKLRTLNLGQNWKLVQGTIYPDTIESGGTKNAALIKTHHNRVPEIQAMIDRGLVVEPLRELYKDEVRLLGRELGLPQALLDRHPFPGPGLGIRLLCHDGKDVPTQFADPPALERILQECFPGSGRPPRPCGVGESGQPAEGVGSPLRPDSPLAQGQGGLQQVPLLCGRILPVKSVGVQGDERSYRHPAVIWSPGGKWPDWPALNACAARLVNQLADINRVVLSLDNLGGERFELRETFVTREGLDRLRKVDDILHRRLAPIPEIWQAPAISLPLFDAAGNQAFVLRPVCSKDAMTADVYPIDFAILAELAREIRAVPGAGHLFYDLTTKPPGTIEWE